MNASRSSRRARFRIWTTPTSREPDAPERLYSSIVQRVSTLSQSPKRARVVPELKDVGIRDYRELILAPYCIPFRISGKVVAVLGVFDSRRELNELLLKRALDPLPFE
ncbi:MAG TPA: type II toxin-antitoxin system RelE/ParE family toxin [Vicinamibacteria bacterium]|nr:type II toxin-antitoxin system RelE/ParE family toxin [Vicinamibacteria bacterium]